MQVNEVIGAEAYARAPMKGCFFVASWCLALALIAACSARPVPRVRVDTSLLQPAVFVEDPGRSEWEVVPEADVLKVCHLDPYELARADKLLGKPWAVIRYGRLCHQYKAQGMRPTRAFSVTKTLGALATGVAAYRTRDLVRAGRKTGPLSDQDRVDHWLDRFSYNKDARIAHVLGMVAHSESLERKEMKYDIIGRTQINSLSDILNTVIRQDPARFGADLEAFTQRFLFQKLGLRNSSWSSGSPDKNFATSFKTDVHDMAKLGLLMLRGGMWQGERLLDAEWIYRMTHPSFEEANTAYGYLTWLNTPMNYHFGGIPAPPPDITQGATLPGPCAPMAIHRQHPHGLSSASSCNLGNPQRCQQLFDVGVWNAVGLGGQVIQGHPGLDMVIVATNLTPLDTGMRAPSRLWDAVKRAVIETDPLYAGDEEAFCQAYGSNRHALDLKPWSAP